MIRAIRRMFTDRSAARTRRRPRASMVFDALEGRQLLTLFGRSQVNHDGAGARDWSANASSPGGLMVAAWIDTVNGVDQVRAQVYNSDKTWSGGEVLVDSAPLYGNDDSPRVAINDAGNFVVTWHQRDQADGLDLVFAAEYDFYGNLINRAIVGNQPGDADSMPDVVMDAWGNFDVSYVASHPDGSEDVMVERFDASGYPTDFLNADPAVPSRRPWVFINPALLTSGGYWNPRIAMAPSGSFVLGYGTSSLLGNTEVYLAGFNADGSRSYSTIVGSGVSEFALAANSWGGVAVASIVGHADGTSSLYLDRIDASGNDYDTVLIDGRGTTLYHPGIAADQYGQVVITYDTSSLFNVPGTSGFEVQEVGSDDSILGSYGLTSGSWGWSDPAVSIDGNGDYFVTYTGSDGTIWDYMGRLDPPA